MANIVISLSLSEIIAPVGAGRRKRRSPKEIEFEDLVIARGSKNGSREDPPEVFENTIDWIITGMEQDPHLLKTWIDEWLLWNSDTEQLATYQADVYDLNLRLDVYPDTRQEIRIKFQWIGVQADAIAGQEIGANGRLSPSGMPVDDFSLSDTAVQIRYRYQLAPLSDIFLVYERGGFWDEDENEVSAGKLYRNAWDDVTRQRVLAKIRYRF